MCVADGARREIAVDQLLACSLNIERSDRRQDSRPENRSDIAPKQALITAIALLSKFRLRSCFEPSIQELFQRNLGSLEAASQVALAEHLR